MRPAAGKRLIVAVTDSAGNVVDTYTYDPFGGDTGMTGTVSNPIRFTGQLLDPASGLYHLRARDYDPTTGRFLQLDPLAPALSDPFVAGYVYASDRPTVFTDPSGLGAIRADGGTVPPTATSVPRTLLGAAPPPCLTHGGCFHRGLIDDIVHAIAKHGADIGSFAIGCVGGFEAKDLIKVGVQKVTTLLGRAILLSNPTAAFLACAVGGGTAVIFGRSVFSK